MAPAGRAARLLAGILLGAATLLAGCASAPDPTADARLAQALASGAGLRWVHLPTASAAPGVPGLAAALPAGPVRGRLTLYIEGDGAAWRTREWPSDDPTPHDPVALRLAARHTDGPAAWLARPCQYVDAVRSGCPPRLWQADRYTEPALQIVLHAMDAIRAETGAREFVLVGFSGGGVLAAAAAARRDDVVQWITVAANLDVGGWTRHHGVTPMQATLDPVRDGPALRRLPQRHFVGAQDRIVPPALVRRFVTAMGASPQRVVTPVDAGHTCCWADGWPQRLQAWPPVTP